MAFDENVTCADRDIINKITDTFGTWDFVIFGLVLLLSAAIGIYFAWVDRKKDSEEYMMGGGKVSPFPIACSLATTFFSAITVLGSPGEYYLYGSMFTYFLVTYGWFYFKYATYHTVKLFLIDLSDSKTIKALCSILVVELFGPIFYRLGVTSTYEYLETRFSRSVRLHISLVFILQTILYIGIVIYGPALALETVTGLDRWTAVWIR